METYYGQVACMGTYKMGNPCRNQAYFQTDQGFFCGQHSKQVDRVKLLVDPNKSEKKKMDAERHAESIKMAREHNEENKCAGQLACSKMRMFKPPPVLEGHLSIFPNFKHGGRRDGMGIPELSPMSLGPVEHRMPGIPVALTIENFHQGSKMFYHEVGDDRQPSEEAIQFRNRFYQDPVPHRHKFARGMLPKENPNIPEFSWMVRQDGEGVRLTYMESRWFYSVWYEYLAQRTHEFEMLLEMHQSGVNLNVVGYDGYEVSKGKEGLYEAYLDTSRPFGHELVLLTLLYFHGERKAYPWNRYAREHPDTYRRFWNPNLRAYMT